RGFGRAPCHRKGARNERLLTQRGRRLVLGDSPSRDRAYGVARHSSCSSHFQAVVPLASATKRGVSSSFGLLRSHWRAGPGSVYGTEKRSRRFLSFCSFG